ncbi:hypothetical protein DICVIV_13648 [Dictyocaulus viviparus]|uniref:Uncharacterized protein n=1 Tax=Dictyocaulus viviparus TaxID=29172 RepID=A0A0D8XDA4_DICVI|nr:hypothetical protein DICVIV_13648 [Dictyocaulus viviparus]
MTRNKTNKNHMSKRIFEEGLDQQQMLKQLRDSSIQGLNKKEYVLKADSAAQDQAAFRLCHADQIMNVPGVCVRKLLCCTSGMIWMREKHATYSGLIRLQMKSTEIHLGRTACDYTIC